MVKRANKACRFFPCHKGLEDCTFCYCPFYPCLNKKRGSYIYSPKLKKDIWSCQNCNWLHREKTVDEIFSIIKASKFIKGQVHPVRKKVQSELSNGVNAKGKTENSEAKTGIIILGHGSRLHKANKLLSEVARIIKKKNNYNFIEPAYLQFHHPDLSASIKKVIEKGCRKVIIVPFFLFEGNHVKRDIPRTVKKAIKRYRDVKFIFTKSLGQDVNISDIVFRNINEAIKECV